MVLPKFGGTRTSIVDIGYDIEAGAKGFVIIPKLKNQFNSWKTDEILGLCRTLEYSVSEVFRQKINTPNPKYYIGRGKVEEIAEYIKENPSVEFAVFDCALKPNQIFNLERTLRVRVLDRNTLILMIFFHHARTKEAKLQIEYAILKYQIPYITELVRRSKLGEHPGLMTGGEYKVEEYYRLTKKRIKKIKIELSKINISRDQRRKNRRKRGFVLATLAGYTNSGKSALLRALTGLDVPVDDRMFSTVSPKTRRFRDTNLLFTDTVGFIRNIPTQLIEAFKSTLEEIIDVDHILLIVDISEDKATIIEKLGTSLRTIDQLVTESYTLPGKNIDAQTSDMMLQKRPNLYLVFNKCDLVADSKTKSEEILNTLQEKIAIYGISSSYIISAKTKHGIKEMIESLNR